MAGEVTEGAHAQDAATEAAFADLRRLLPALLATLDALAYLARRLHPPEFAEALAVVGEPDAELATLRPALELWPQRLAAVASALATTSDAALEGFAEIRAAGDLRGVFRALRKLPRALESLYPLAAVMPPVSRFFLEPDARTNTVLVGGLERAGSPPEAGVLHGGGEPGARGGFSAYVPETYAADRDWPLVMALHGGSGNGRAFLWSWLATARGRGAIVVAPTAVGDTWALMGEDGDTPNLAAILALVRDRWRIDPKRILLTGMSDGGTFTLVSGLESGSPFTHLAPVAAAFHPILAQMADADRIRGLPIHLTHGALDWMFPVEGAREAEAALSAAGARVTYREIADLSHCYPREMNAAILDWLTAS